MKCNRYAIVHVQYITLEISPIYLFIEDIYTYMLLRILYIYMSTIACMCCTTLNRLNKDDKSWGTTRDLNNHFIGYARVRHLVNFD